MNETFIFKYTQNIDTNTYLQNINNELDLNKDIVICQCIEEMFDTDEDNNIVGEFVAHVTYIGYDKETDNVKLIRETKDIVNDIKFIELERFKEYLDFISECGNRIVKGIRLVGDDNKEELIANIKY